MISLDVMIALHTDMTLTYYFQTHANAHMTSTPPANTSEYNNDQFWKSHSMDTINQLLNGCHNMNIPLTPIGADVKVDIPNTIVSTSSSCGITSITSSLSFSSVFPALQNTNSGSSFVPATPPTPCALPTTPIPNSSPISQSHSSQSQSQGQACDATTSSPIAIQNSYSSSSNSMSLVPSMLMNYHAITPSNHPHREIVKVEKEPTYVDVTPFLILPQHEAARRLGVPCSTLSKRWKEASVNRKWPYRIVCKLDKEITTLLKNVENSANNLSSPLSPAIEENLGLLLKKRQEELRTVVIRIN